MKTLKDAKVGDTVTVAKLHGEGAVKRRIWIWGSPREWRSTSERSPRWGTLWS